MNLGVTPMFFPSLTIYALAVSYGFADENNFSILRKSQSAELIVAARPPLPWPRTINCLLQAHMRLNHPASVLNRKLIQ